MIIKMQEGDGWAFLDNIKTIESYPYNPRNKMDMGFFDETRHEIREPVTGGPDEPMPSAVYIMAHRLNGDTLGIVSNRSIYLLSDNGKTIERLN